MLLAQSHIQFSGREARKPYNKLISYNQAHNSSSTLDQPWPGPPPRYVTIYTCLYICIFFGPFGNLECQKRKERANMSFLCK